MKKQIDRLFGFLAELSDKLNKRKPIKQPEFKIVSIKKSEF